MSPGERGGTLVTEVPGGVLTRRSGSAPFEVHLDVFEGPFDLLLGLIAKHKLDITVIALAQVTDEFIAHIKAMRAEDEEWDLGQASEFLLVAATLLELKAARLLPGSGPEDDEDLALIEARDLLFARLLQYRAFKEVARELADSMAAAAHSLPRRGGLEPRFAALLPDLIMTVTPDQLALIAARALEPKEPPSVRVDHLHQQLVSVRDQAGILVARLRRDGVLSFRSLVADAESTLVVVARFLAVLELYRERVVTVEQAEALGELTVRWTGEDIESVEVSDEFDIPDDGNRADDARTQADDAQTEADGARDRATGRGAPATEEDTP